MKLNNFSVSLLLCLTLFVSYLTHAQTDSTFIPPKVMEYENYYIFEGDTLFIQLDEVHLPTKVYFKNRKDQIYYKWLTRKVHKAYPYAKLANDKLTVINQHLKDIKSKRQKKKYLKRMQNYFEDQFTEQLKKLTRTEGRILIKLIHRQMGTTVFDLIKDYRSGWKAYWNNNTARLFKLNLKATYQPATDNEDYLTELILEKAFFEGTLTPQPSVLDFDFNEIKSKKGKYLEVEPRIKF